jgi:hypothetical protein
MIVFISSDRNVLNSQCKFYSSDGQSSASLDGKEAIRNQIASYIYIYSLVYNFHPIA